MGGSTDEILNSGCLSEDGGSELGAEDREPTAKSPWQRLVRGTHWLAFVLTIFVKEKIGTVRYGLCVS